MPAASRYFGPRYITDDPNRQRFGTARRRSDGSLAPGEYGRDNQPLKSGAGVGMTPAHDWSGFDAAFGGKPPAGASTDFGSVMEKQFPGWGLMKPEDRAMVLRTRKEQHPEAASVGTVTQGPIGAAYTPPKMIPTAPKDGQAFSAVTPYGNVGVRFGSAMPVAKDQPTYRAPAVGTSPALKDVPETAGAGNLTAKQPSSEGGYKAPAGVSPAIKDAVPTGNVAANAGRMFGTVGQAGVSPELQAADRKIQALRDAGVDAKQAEFGITPPADDDEWKKWHASHDAGVAPDVLGRDLQIERLRKGGVSAQDAERMVTSQTPKPQSNPVQMPMENPTPEGPGNPLGRLRSRVNGVRSAGGPFSAESVGNMAGMVGRAIRSGIDGQLGGVGAMAKAAAAGAKVNLGVARNFGSNLAQDAQRWKNAGTGLVDRAVTDAGRWASLGGKFAEGMGMPDPMETWNNFRAKRKNPTQAPYKAIVAQAN